MTWILLFAAGLLEVVRAVGLKYTDGFTRLWPSVITIAAMIASIVPLDESREIARLLRCIRRIVTGIVELKPTTPH